MRTTLTVDEDGFLTIPEDILQETGWKEGDLLEWIENEDGTLELRKVDES